jgi:type I restriction enzyme R subunit
VNDDPKAVRYEPIALSDESTVVAEFVRPTGAREERYQSEAELERLVSYFERFFSLT